MEKQKKDKEKKKLEISPTRGNVSKIRGVSKLLGVFQNLVAKTQNMWSFTVSRLVNEGSVKFSGGAR